MSRLVDELEEERAKSRRLLLNVLPQRIADRLAEGEARIADRHDDVTVLFSDFVGFTRISAAARRRPCWSTELNELFRGFDGICEATGVEKIKTVGDAYLAVGGLVGDGVGRGDGDRRDRAADARRSSQAHPHRHARVADPDRHPRRAGRRRRRRRLEVRVRRLGRHGQHRQPAGVDVGAEPDPRVRRRSPTAFATPTSSSRADRSTSRAMGRAETYFLDAPPGLGRDVGLGLGLRQR